MLIQFLARLIVGTCLVVAQILFFQSQEWQRNERSAKKFIPFNIHNEITVMEKIGDKQSDQSKKGLQQRRSYHSLVEQDEMDIPQAVEMSRTGSSCSTLKSEKSTSSLKSDSSGAKGSLEKKIPGQPNNFGTVVPGVYRSSYPQEADYAFLKKLGLKTIV